MKGVLKTMKQKLLRCGKLYDGIHRDIQEKVDILVDGDRIQAVGKNLRPDSGAEVLDLMHLTVTPRTFWTGTTTGRIQSCAAMLSIRSPT